MQIVGGENKDDIIPQGDFDSDRVLGDQGVIRVFERQAYDMVAEPRGVLNADDIIKTGDDGDVIIGGDDGDKIMGEDGDDIQTGDNARAILFEGEVIGFGDKGDDDKHQGDDDDDHGDDDADPYNIKGLQLIAPTVGGDDILEGGRGDDWSFGGVGDDTYVFAGERLGHDRVVDAGENYGDDDDWGDDDDDYRGGAPSAFIRDTGDALDYSDFNGPIDVQLGKSGKQTVNGHHVKGDLNSAVTLFYVNAIEDVAGSIYSDRIDGNSRNNAILGNDGNDHITGLGGSDFLDGGVGHDTVFGDGGDDDDDYRGDDDDDASSIGQNVILGGLGDDLLFGGIGNDLIDGEEGDDTLYGDVGDDDDDYKGDDDNDDASNLGRDILFGGIGRDKLVGGFGSDVLVGGPDQPHLSGPI